MQLDTPLLRDMREAENLRRSRIVSALRPLIEEQVRSQFEMRCVASELNVPLRTIYYYRKILEERGVFTSSLAKGTPGPKPGFSRYSAAVDEIINEVIQKYGQTSQKPPVTELLNLARDECRRREIPASQWPRIKGFTARVRKLNAFDWTRKREGRRAAERYEATPGEFPMPTRPNAVWLIDHTPADIILVDRLTRQVIGKPTVTFIIDAYSRAIPGYEVSLGHPSIVQSAMAMIRAISDKQEWLNSIGLGHHRWPVHGLCEILHSDNAAEFHSTPLARGCVEFLIGQSWRKIGVPRYGALIERLIGTKMGAVHLLPGTTFSNPNQRGEYDSEKEAVMTLDDFDRWMALQVIKYHQQQHDGLDGFSPISRWEMGPA
jgi:putative transposase